MYIPWLFGDMCNPCGMNADVNGAERRREWCCHSSHAVISGEIIHTTYALEQPQHSNGFGLLA